MADTEKAKRIANLLKELQNEGAVIGQGKKPKIPDEVLKGLDEGALKDFDAWVSWTMSF